MSSVYKFPFDKIPFDYLSIFLNEEDFNQFDEQLNEQLNEQTPSQ